MKIFQFRILKYLFGSKDFEKKMNAENFKVL